MDFFVYFRIHWWVGLGKKPPVAMPYSYRESKPTFYKIRNTAENKTSQKLFKMIKHSATLQYLLIKPKVWDASQGTKFHWKSHHLSTEKRTAKPVRAQSHPQWPPPRIISVASHSMLFNTPQHTFQLLIRLSGQNRQQKQTDHFSPDPDFQPTIIYLCTAVFTNSSPAAPGTQSSVTWYGFHETSYRDWRKDH